MFLGDQFRNHGTKNIGQADISAAISVGKLGVVDSHLVQDGGMNVVDREGFIDDGIAKIVGIPINHASLETASGHENGVSVDVVISTSSG